MDRGKHSGDGAAGGDNHFTPGDAAAYDKAVAERFPDHPELAGRLKRAAEALRGAAISEWLKKETLNNYGQFTAELAEKTPNRTVLFYLWGRIAAFTGGLKPVVELGELLAGSLGITLRPQGGPPREPPADERRAAPRRGSALKVVCYPAGAGLRERRQGRVRDVSHTGIGLVVDRDWQAGTALVVERPAEGGFKGVRATVVHTAPQLAGTFLVGCVLEMPLTDAEVECLTS
jgi:hypothetical protein